MSLENISVDKWHKDEKEWWDKYGNYMTYQWKLNPSLNKILIVYLSIFIFIPTGGIGVICLVILTS